MYSGSVIMVLIEFERPSTWSIGQKIGVIAIILLLVGPFLPYWAREYRIGDVESSDDVAYSSFGTFGLFILIPILSAILIAIVLYFKLNISIEKDGERIRINHFILMVLGFWFFLIYLVDALRIMDLRIFSIGYILYYAGYGLWMIVIGYLLCAIAGFIEWRNTSKKGESVSKISLSNEKVPGVTEVGAKPSPVTGVAPNPITNTNVIKVGSVPNPSPNPGNPHDPGMMETFKRGPATEEEKTLIRWARHINRDGQTFEQCIKCNNYTFISAKDSGDFLLFKCPDCGASFKLKK